MLSTSNDDGKFFKTTFLYAFDNPKMAQVERLEPSYEQSIFHKSIIYCYAADGIWTRVAGLGSPRLLAQIFINLARLDHSRVRNFYFYKR